MSSDWDEAVDVLRYPQFVDAALRGRLPVALGVLLG